MTWSEIVGYALFSIALLVAGAVFQYGDPGSITGNSMIPWLCYASGLGLLCIGAVCLVAGTSVA